MWHGQVTLSGCGLTARKLDSRNPVHGNLTEAATGWLPLWPYYPKRNSRCSGRPLRVKDLSQWSWRHLWLQSTCLNNPEIPSSLALLNPSVQDRKFKNQNFISDWFQKCPKMLIFPHAFADNIKQFSSFRKVENRFIWRVFGRDQDCKHFIDLFRIL